MVKRAQKFSHAIHIELDPSSINKLIKLFNKKKKKKKLVMYKTVFVEYDNRKLRSSNGENLDNG